MTKNIYPKLSLLRERAIDLMHDNECKICYDNYALIFEDKSDCLYCPLTHIVASFIDNTILTHPYVDVDTIAEALEIDRFIILDLVSFFDSSVSFIFIRFPTASEALPYFLQAIDKTLNKVYGGYYA